jgi:hypothetical protein
VEHTSGHDARTGVLFFVSLTHSRINVYVLLVCSAAGVASVAVFLQAPAFDLRYAQGTLFLAVLGVISQFLVFKLPVAGLASISFIPFLAVALVAPNWIAVAVVAAANIFTEILNRRVAQKAIFNVAQMTLATSLAILVFNLLEGHSLLELRNSSFLSVLKSNALPFACLAAVFFVVNTLAVSGAIATSQRKPVLHVWSQNTLNAIPYDVLASPVAYLLGWTYVSFGALGATLLAIPLFGVRQVYKTNSQLEQVNQELLQLMVKAIEARDPYTSGHSRRVAHYSKIIARAIGLGARQIERVGTAALLHDVGKIHEVYAPILRKPDRLTADEWAIMQTHPIRSAELVSTVSHLQDLVAPLRHHHENWDGTGYPDGIAGNKIPLESRIIMFADTIDAMTTDRPYRQALGEADVRSEFAKHRGKQFDPSICDKLLTSALCSLLFVPAERELTPLSNRPVAARSPRSRLALGA